MTTEENKNIVRRFNKEFIEGGSMDAFNETVASDFVNHTAPPGVPTGPEGVLIFFNNLLKPAFSNFKVEIHDQIAEDDKVTTRKSFHGSHTSEFMGVPATGRAVRIDVIDVVTLRGGKFYEHWGIVDMASLMAQIS